MNQIWKQYNLKFGFFVVDKSEYFWIWTIFEIPEHYLNRKRNLNKEKEKKEKLKATKPVKHPVL